MEMQTEVTTTSPNQEVPVEPTKPETVSREEFEHVMSDLHRQKAEAKAAKELVEKLKMQGMKEKDDWKNVASEYETKYREAETKLTAVQGAIVTDKKMSAIRMEARKAGMLDSALEDLELIDFPEVGIETTSTGRMNVLGVDRAVQRLKATRGHWFSKATPNINSNTPDTTTSGRVSYEELEKLSAEARKSGNWKPYEEKLKQYRTQ